MNRLPDMNAAMELLAARMGQTVEELHRACSRRPLFSTPGKVVDGEKPLPIGSVLNLRRQFPGTDLQKKLDLGWVVAGYTRKSDGRWFGYVLARGAFGVETNSMSKAEAFDLVERYEVLPT